LTEDDRCALWVRGRPEAALAQVIEVAAGIDAGIAKRIPPKSPFTMGKFAAPRSKQDRWRKPLKLRQELTPESRNWLESLQIFRSE
jgi:hypothetical protein